MLSYGNCFVKPGCGSRGGGSVQNGGRIFVVRVCHPCPPLGIVSHAKVSDLRGFCGPFYASLKLPHRAVKTAVALCGEGRPSMLIYGDCFSKRGSL